MLKVENLTKQYFYGQKAIDNLTFEINKGEVVAVVGASESGKTSLLKCIAGLYSLEEGKIYIDGKDVSEAKIKERDVKFLYSDSGYGIFKRRTVKHNIGYPLKVRKVKKDVRVQKVEEVAEKYDIKSLLNDYGYMLYEDDILRVIFARKDIRNASVTLIDDVFKIVKSEDRAKLFNELHGHIRDENSAVLFATTSIDEAFSVADRVIILNYGKCQQVATAEELKSNPKTLTVEKLVNPYRTIIESEEVITTYDLEENELGEEYGVVSHTYERGKYVVVTELGIITTGVLKNSYKLRVKPNSERYFNPISEERIEKAL